MWCYICLLFWPVKRYGLKLKTHIRTARFAFLFLVLTCMAMNSPTADAQLLSSWWGSSSWWDWSDYRAHLGYRISLPSIEGKVEARGETHDLSEFGFSDDPEMFKSFLFEFYVDRLGVRIAVEEDHKFRGRTGDDTVVTNPSLSAPYLNAKISELDFSGVRMGLDLDIIRYPFARGGINFTYYTEQIRFQDRRNDDPFQWQQYTGSQPLQLGLHGRLMPARIRNVPLTIQGRFRMPVPLVQRPTEAKITEWEVSGGLRPAVWETSLFGHSTFSFGIEAGYRESYLTLHARPQRNFYINDDSEVNVTARWGGAFIQALIVY